MAQKVLCTLYVRIFSKFILHFYFTDFKYPPWKTDRMRKCRSIRITANRKSIIRISDTTHTRITVQNNIKHRLIKHSTRTRLKRLSLRSTKLMTPPVLDFSSNVSHSPSTFLNDTSVGSACVGRYADINAFYLRTTPFVLFNKVPSYRARLSILLHKSNVNTSSNTVTTCYSTEVTLRQWQRHKNSPLSRVTSRVLVSTNDRHK